MRRDNRGLDKEEIVLLIIVMCGVASDNIIINEY